MVRKVGMAGGLPSIHWREISDDGGRGSIFEPDPQIPWLREKPPDAGRKWRFAFFVPALQPNQLEA